MEWILKNFGAFITIVFAIGGLIWHLIDRYFDYKKHKEDYISHKEEYKAKAKVHDETLDSLKNMLTTFLASCDGRDASLESKILLKVAEQEKQIVLKILEQESRNSQETKTLTRVFTDIEKQLGLMNINITSQGVSIDKMTMKIDGIERERLEDLKDKLDAYRNLHKDKP